MLMSSAKAPYGIWSLKGVLANQAGKGKKGGENFETALQARVDHEASYIALSYLYYRLANIDYGHTLADIMLGTTIQKVKIDGEISFGRDSRSATVVPGTFTGTANDWGIGYQVAATVDVTDKLAAGIRGEYTSDMPAQYKGMQISAGPAYKVNEAMTLKADYTYRSVEVTQATAKVKTNFLNAAAQFRF
jgi:opacity protein-like surface antigen